MAKIKCKDCKHYMGLDFTFGLCRYFLPQDRVNCNNSCKNAESK